MQSRRNAKAARRFLRKLLKKQCAVLRVLVTDRFGSYGATHRQVMPSAVEHRQSQYPNNRGPRRHRLTDPEYRAEMTDRFTIWDQVTGLVPAV